MQPITMTWITDLQPGVCGIKLFSYLWMCLCDVKVVCKRFNAATCRGENARSAGPQTPHNPEVVQSLSHQHCHQSLSSYTAGGFAVCPHSLQSNKSCAHIFQSCAEQYVNKQILRYRRTYTLYMQILGSHMDISTRCKQDDLLR